MSDEESAEEITVKREYENEGFKIQELEKPDEIIDKLNVFKVDHHGFPTDSSQVKIFEDKGYKKCTGESSYGEALLRIQHREEEAGLALFMCSFCEIYFENPKRFVIHYKWHRWGERTEAPKRDRSKKVKKNDEIKVEENEECTAEKTFECDICKSVYGSNKSLKMHRIRVHFATPRECNICNKTFTNQAYLNSHLLSHSENKFMCTDCPKTFKFLHSLQRHQPTHLTEKNFPCDECGKAFGSDLLLKIHFKTHQKHLQEKSYKCSFCAKAFHHSFSLQSHERVHTGEKPFPCELCNQRYPSKSSLMRHMKVSHSTDLPHACEICGRGFHVRSALDYHIRRTHFKERPFPCQYCDSKYICQSELYKHQIKFHPGLDTVEPVESRQIIKYDEEGVPIVPVKAKKKKKKKKRKKYSDDSS